MRMIAFASGDQFTPQPRILVDFKDVNAGMGHTRFSQLFERSSPGVHSLMRQSSDQVYIDVVDGGSPESRHIRQSLLRSVQSAHRFDFMINKRLRPETDAICTAFEQSVEDFWTQRSRRAFDCDLCRG